MSCIFFVQFMQFPILDFGLAHYGSEPQILNFSPKLNTLKDKWRPTPR